MEVIAGTYEEFLLGYSFSKNTLEQTFAAHDHTASIRTIALSGQYLASGGTDDRIFIYDLKTRKEICSLINHNATVTALTFAPNHTHLLSGSLDGVFAIHRVGNWQLEKFWEKPHKGAAILDIAVHSSGKLALTLGADATLCTWNLVKGRQAYVINLNNKSKDARSLEKILWAEDGVRFVLYGGRFVEIWSIENGGLLDFSEHKEKVTSCMWFTESSLVIGHENGSLTLMDIHNKRNTDIQAHSARIKDVKMYKEWIVTVSSNGEIKVWTLEFKELVSFDTGCRLTCLELLPSSGIKKEEEEQQEVEDIPNEKSEEGIFKPYIVEETEEEVPAVKVGKKRNAKRRESSKKKKKINKM